MKAKLYSPFLVIVIALLSFGSPLQKKKITDTNYRYEFYTTLENAEPKENRFYHWFKAGAIHTSENGISGELLAGNFEKFYLDNQMAEKGEFSKGLKIGTWKTWHKNGTLDTRQYWKDGRKSGSFLSYDTNGFLVEKGQYSRGKKYGKWINYIKKDTVTYKNDLVFIKKPTKTKEERQIEKEKLKAEKAKRKLLKEENKKMKAVVKSLKAKGTEKTQNKPNQKAAKKETTKNEGFLKRLFSKKPKPQPNDTGE
jgi:hypothetical protein